MNRHRRGRAAGAAAITVATLLWAGTGAVPAGSARADVTPGPWLWPLDPRPRVLHEFEAPASTYAAGHRGVDLEARIGQSVRSAGPGVVAFAGAVAGRGVVSVEHPGGRRTTYEPVVAVVGRGDAVAAGADLGTVSSAPGHCLPVTCLHWGLRHGEVYLDPLALLGVVRVRLLPVWTVDGPVAGIGAPVGLARERLTGPDRGPLLARG